MLFAMDTKTGALLSGEEAANIGTEYANGLTCEDPECDTGLTFRAGQRRRPHWAHKRGTQPGCGGGGGRMTAKHLLMRDKTEHFWLWEDNPLHESSNETYLDLQGQGNLPYRWADVDVTLDYKSHGKLWFTCECQHSPSSLEREESRIQDHNLYGLPVILVVSSTCVPKSLEDEDYAHPQLWVQDWAFRHGRQQFACMDDEGDMWWCWFDKRTPSPERYMERVKLTPQLMSTDEKWKLGVTVSATQPSSPGSPSLWIVAFCWVPVTHKDRAPARQPFPGGLAWDQPENQPQPFVFGLPNAKKLFDPDTVITGGF